MLVILLVARAGEAVIGPATPIVEMVGHRALPLINSIIGLSLWLMLGFWLVPVYGAAGMAIAVSVAVVVTAWLAVFELKVSDRLTPFGTGFWRAAAVGVATVGLLWTAGEFMSPSGARVRALVLFALFWPILWLGLKLGLDAQDKAALGKFGRTLRL